MLMFSPETPHLAHQISLNSLDRARCENSNNFPKTSEANRKTAETRAIDYTAAYITAL